MSKQDRQGVRTPADVERKYNLGRLASAQGSSAKAELQIQQLSQTLAQFMATTKGTLEELKNVESTQTWFNSGVPTLENAPAVEWTEKQKETHIGDLYFNEDDGSLYLFKCTDGVYAWVKCSSATEGTESESYNVTFYSENKVVIAAYIIKQGDAVNPPVNDVTWKDGNGNKITFPYTPTSDVDLTISLISSYDEELYEHFGMSKEEYPYLAIGILYSSNKTRVYFSKEPLNNVTSVSYKHITVNTTSGLADVTDAKTVVEWVKSKFVAPFSFNSATWTTMAGTYFANYSIENTDTVTCYPL